MLTRRHFVTALGPILGGGAAIGAPYRNNDALPAPVTDTEIAKLYGDLREVRQDWNRVVAPTLPPMEAIRRDLERPWHPIERAIAAAQPENPADVLRKMVVQNSCGGPLEFRNEFAMTVGNEMFAFVGRPY